MYHVTLTNIYITVLEQVTRKMTRDKLNFHEEVCVCAKSVSVESSPKLLDISREIVVLSLT